MSVYTKGIELVLGALQTAASSAASKPTDTQSAGGTAGIKEADFASVLQKSIDQVNQTQQQADAMAANFAAGDGNTNLHDVMIELQKANVSFQEMVQVRNKLVSAYQTMMNMQV